MSVKLKEKIVEEMKKEINLTNLLSCSIIGSFIKKKELDKITDIDVLLVFSKIDENIYNKTLEEFRNICERLSDENLNFVIEDRYGPLKHEDSDSRDIIQFHLLFMDIDIFRKLPSVVKFEYANTSSLSIKGSPLKELFGESKAEINDVVNETWGLKTCLNMIENFQIPYYKWKFTFVPEFHDIKDSHEFFEAIQYSTLTACMNFLRVNYGFFERQEGEILNKVRKIFPEHAKTLETIIETKKRLRSTGELGNIDLVGLRHESLNLIRDLINRSKPVI